MAEVIGEPLTIEDLNEYRAKLWRKAMAGKPLTAEETIAATEWIREAAYIRAEAELEERQATDVVLAIGRMGLSKDDLPSW